MATAPATKGSSELHSSGKEVDQYIFNLTIHSKTPRSTPRSLPELFISTVAYLPIHLIGQSRSHPSHHPSAIDVKIASSSTGSPRIYLTETAKPCLRFPKVGTDPGQTPQSTKLVSPVETNSHQNARDPKTRLWTARVRAFRTGFWLQFPPSLPEWIHPTPRFRPKWRA